VGKRVKAMAKGFYGRLAAYGEALDGAEPHHLADALRRNVFRNRETDADRLARLAAYVRRQEATLAACPIETLMAGTVAFGPPPAPE
jgi:cytochrome b pre-mRNA-processing protein 3